MNDYEERCMVLDGFHLSGDVSYTLYLLYRL